MSLPERAVAAIWAIGLGGLLFRIWTILEYRPTCDIESSGCFKLAGDSAYIHEQANLIGEGHLFINPFEFETSGTVIDSAGDPPLYALYLGFWSRLGADSITAHRLVSTVCGMALIVLIGLFVRRLAGAAGGVAAAAIAALHPLLWINDSMLLVEGLYQPFVVVVLWMAYRWIDHPDWQRVAVLGAAISVASLVRAEAVVLFVFMVPPLVGWARTLDRQEKLRQIGVCWAAGILVLAPWVGWNMVRFEKPVTITSGSGQVLMAGSCDEAWRGEWMGFWSNCFISRGLAEEFDAEFPGANLIGEDRVVYDESKRDEFSRRHALEYIGDNWERYPLVALARVGRSLEVYRVGHTLRANHQIEGRWKAPSTVGLGVYYALVPLSVVGAFALRRSGQRLTPFLGIWLAVMFASATTFGLTRYRVPIDIAMVVLTGVAIDELWKRARGRPIEVAP